jgi:hypothetical protein
MNELAARTGAAVIEPHDHRPINIQRPTRSIDISPYCAAAGALLLGLALVQWRRQ